MEDNRYMSLDPKISEAYWHEEALRLEKQNKSAAEDLEYVNGLRWRYRKALDQIAHLNATNYPEAVSIALDALE
jgi:hypothetical protein